MGVFKNHFKMPIDIHGMNLSGPCRIIYMTAECLGLEYNMIECDLFKGENKTEEYLKLNIQHSIPTLVDGKTILNESRVAAAYLVNKYGKDDKSYPKDIRRLGLWLIRCSISTWVFCTKLMEKSCIPRSKAKENQRMISTRGARK